MKRIRVVIVEDSAVMRIFLKDALGACDDIEVVGAAHDPFIAREMIRRLEPDVITLDIHMPEMDGLDFLERLMKLKPMPVIMFSALTQDGSQAALQALAQGAVDFVAKPSGSAPEAWSMAGQELIMKIISAAGAQIQACLPSVDAEAPEPAEAGASVWPRNRLVAIGSSTGGVRALREILFALPEIAPPIVVAQHMPASFTRSFARRLDGMSKLRVREAADGMEIEIGNVYIAPGDAHLMVETRRGARVCRVEEGVAINGHMPSVDVLFHSVAQCAGAAAMGIVLTGMGRDGVEGLGVIKAVGGATAAQDQASSLIFGMPKAAIESGAANIDLPLSRIADFILAPKPRRRAVMRSEFGIASDAV